MLDSEHRDSTNDTGHAKNEKEECRQFVCPRCHRVRWMPNAPAHRPGAVTLDLKPRCPRRVRCSRLVRQLDCSCPQIAECQSWSSFPWLGALGIILNVLRMRGRRLEGSLLSPHAPDRNTRGGKRSCLWRLAKRPRNSVDRCARWT
jgi:hypothetical protein